MLAVGEVNDEAADEEEDVVVSAGESTISRAFKDPFEISSVEGDGNPEYPGTEV